MATGVFIAVVVARFVFPLFIPRYPLPAIVACLVLDAADQSIFQAFTNDPLTGYQSYDKALDVYYLAVAYFSSMRNWRQPVAFEVARFLYLYRLVGVTIFELGGPRWLLLVFPNTFEYFFIAYEVVRTRWNPAHLSARAIVGLAAFIWVVIKLPQEWWIHIAKLDFTDFTGDHPIAWLVIAAAAAMLAIAGWTQRARIPSRDWAFTTDVDRHLPRLDETPTGRERFWSGILAEKVVLLALVSVIFAQVLPDVEASNLGLGLGVAMLVVINSAASQWLRRHGQTWRSAGQTFVAMLVINAVIVELDSLLGPNDRSDSPAFNTWFFVVLLSLLIALYDRFRSTRDPGELRRVSVWGRVRAGAPA